MKKSYTYLLLAIIIVAVVAFAVVVYYAVTSNNTETENSNFSANANTTQELTKNWKTYTNTEGRFSIKYNDTWYPHENGSMVIISEKKDFDLQNPDPQQAQFSIAKHDVVDARGNALTSEQWVKQYMGPHTTVTVNGLSMLRAVDTSGPSLSYTYIKDHSYFEITQYPYDAKGQNTKDFEAAIQTFTLLAS